MFDQHHPIRKCLKKNLFSLVLFLRNCTEEENVSVYVYFIRGVFDVQVYTIIIVIPYVYALHKWTEHIFVKWPTGNNGIHHEEKT